MNHIEKEQRILSGRLESLVDICARNNGLMTEKLRTAQRLPVMAKRATLEK